MLQVSATDFAKKMGQYRRAAHREPVAVTDRSGVTEVLISKADFDEFMLLRAQQARTARRVERQTATDRQKAVRVKVAHAGKRPPQQPAKRPETPSDHLYEALFDAGTRPRRRG